MSLSIALTREGTRFPPVDYPQTLAAPVAKVQSMIASSMLRYGALESVLERPLSSEKKGMFTFT